MEQQKLSQPPPTAAPESLSQLVTQCQKNMLAMNDLYEAIYKKAVELSKENEELKNGDTGRDKATPGDD